jgi:hypothetical protein
MMVRMAQVFALPFRVVGGRVATVEGDSDSGHAQEIAVLCSTLKGERVLVPDYGISDPVGVGLDLAEINACLALYGPGVTVDSLDVDWVDPGTQTAVLTFSSDGNQS